MICASDYVSLQEIAARLSLSVPTVLTAVRNLQQDGLVREAGEFASTGGRKAKAFSPVPGSRHSVGVEITPNYAEFTAVNLVGLPVTLQRHDFPFVCNNGYFRRIASLAKRFVASGIFDPDSVLGVGFSIPGVVSADQRTVEFSHILGLADLPTEKIGRDLPWPKWYVNDANAAGVAEFYNRDYKGNAIYLMLSASVGGAIVIGGELYLGNNQRSGEFGHNTIVPNGKVCYCGKKGCLDAYCSSKELSKASNLGIDDFFPQLRTENARLRKIWDEYVIHIAAAVNNIRMTFDCDVVLGGHIGSRMGEYFEDIQKRVAKLNTFGNDASYVRTCRFKPGSPSAGAALKHIASLMSGETMT
jgi:predicted NBD/HSP70 family sugar kinase